MYNPTIETLELIYENGFDCPINDGHVRMVPREEKKDEEVIEGNS